LTGLYILADNRNGRRGLQRISASEYVAAQSADLDIDLDIEVVRAKAPRRYAFCATTPLRATLEIS
jgi:hypothetical protein